MSNLVNVIMGVCDKLITFFPTDKKKVEKYEYIKLHIDYEDGEKQKLYLEKCRRKVLFKMSTELDYNEKNVAVFESFMKNNDLVNHFRPRLANYFELSDSKLCVIDGKMAKIKQKVYFCYWKIIAVLSSLYFIYMPLSIYLHPDQILFVVTSSFVSLIIMVLCLVMIGNKRRDLHSIKLYKESIQPSSK